MKIRNLSPFSQIVYASEDARGRLFDILIVKASYCFSEKFALVQAFEQEPLNFSDTCFGAVNETSLRYPSDLVPYKPVTDIIVIADAFAPNGAPSEEWDCAVSVGHLMSEITVTGPVFWKRKPIGWKLTQPELTTRVPLRYELTYGGEAETKSGGVFTQETNPLGVGFYRKDQDFESETMVAPQVLQKGTRPIDPFRQLEPAGFGPVPPAWLPRRRLGGTYDEDWVANRWPHWAEDYDFQFHNSAARGLKYKGFMTGSETVILKNLHPTRDCIQFDLPNDPVFVHFVDCDGKRKIHRLNLDTVYIDILDAEPEDCLISLTWRIPFLDADVEWLEIDHQANVNAMRTVTNDPTLYPAPHPEELFHPEVAHVQ